MKEPPRSMLTDLNATANDRRRWEAFIAGRKAAGCPEWALYRLPGSPPIARRPFTEDEAA